MRMRMGVTYTVDSGILRLKATGIWGLETAKEAQNRALEITSEKKVDKLIINISEADNTFTIEQIYEINTRVPQVFPRHFKHAIIFSERSMNLIEAEFSENISVNRGVNIRMFQHEKDALNWLLGN